MALLSTIARLRRLRSRVGSLSRVTWLLLSFLLLPLLLLVAARNPFPGHANRRGHAVCITQVDRICMLAQLQEEGACALWYRHLHN